MGKYTKYIITFFTEFLILFLGIIVYKIVNERFNNTQFTEYNLFRRSSSLFQPLIMCGLGVSIPKFTSKYLNRNSLLIVGFFILFIVVSLFGSVFLIFHEFFSVLLFGNKIYSNLIFLLVLMLFGAGFHSIVYGYLRGKFLYGYANIFQLFNIGLVPVLTLFVYKDISNVFFLNSIIWIISSVIVFIFLVLFYKPKINKVVIKHDLIKLLYFGLPRIPGDFALLILISLPSFIVLHIYNDFKLAGFVAFSTTMLNLVGAAFGPIGLILLPETNRLIKNKEIDKLKKITRKILIITTVLIFIGLVIFSLFPSFFLDLLVSETDVKLISACKIMLLGGFGYALYLNLRSILDAFYFKPVNSVNLLKTLFFLILMVLITWYFNLSFEYLLYSFSISMSLLGLLTYYKVISILKLH